MADDRKLYILELMMMGVSSIIAAGLGFYGVYLGQKALTMTAESESLQVRPVLTVERHPGNPSLKVFNIGFGPAEVVHLRLAYQDAEGGWVTFDSDLGESGGRFLDFFGLEGINEGLPGELAVRSFDPLGVWGAEEVINILTVPGRNAMPQEWRVRWEDTVDRIVDTAEFCLVYVSIDDYEQTTGSGDEICDADLPFGVTPYDAGR